jgi:hypothetical protein
MASDTLRPPVVQYSSIHWRTLSCPEEYSFVARPTAADGGKRQFSATLGDRRSFTVRSSAIPRRASFQAICSAETACGETALPEVPNDHRKIGRQCDRRHSIGIFCHRRATQAAHNDLPRTLEYAFLPGENHFRLQIQRVSSRCTTLNRCSPLWVSCCSVRRGSRVETESSLRALT